MNKKTNKKRIAWNKGLIGKHKHSKVKDIFKQKKLGRK